MVLSIAGIISYKMLPADPKARYFAKGGRKGISAKLAGALGMALLFALVESFLAGTSNHSFIWVYKWWGVLPVFATTYIPFLLAANYVPAWWAFGGWLPFYWSCSFPWASSDHAGLGEGSAQLLKWHDENPAFHASIHQ